MKFEMPWENEAIKRIVDAFDCTVMECVVIKEEEPTRLVTWRDDTDGGKVIVERMTEKQFFDLCNQLDRYDVGAVLGSGWWEGGSK